MHDTCTEMLPYVLQLQLHVTAACSSNTHRHCNCSGQISTTPEQVSRDGHLLLVACWGPAAASWGLLESGVDGSSLTMRVARGCRGLSLKRLLRLGAGCGMQERSMTPELSGPAGAKDWNFAASSVCVWLGLSTTAGLPTEDAACGAG